MRTYPKRRLILGLAILAVSLLLLLWGLWPAPEELRTVPVFPADMQLPTQQSGLLWQPKLLPQPAQFSAAFLPWMGRAV